jgi:uncharacterized membrane protein YhaH (DUF805 family)
MDFVTAIKTCLSKYATFSGRASRPEYWWFFLFEVLVLVGTAMVSDWLYAIAALALLLPALAVGVRRLHDVGRSGWFLLLAIIPLVNLILLYWAVQPSGPANEFGSGPDLPTEAAALPPGAA